MEVEGGGGGQEDTKSVGGDNTNTGTLKRCNSAPMIAAHIPNNIIPLVLSTNCSTDTNTNSNNNNNNNVSVSHLQNLQSQSPNSDLNNHSIHPHHQPVLNRDGNSSFNLFSNNSQQRTRRFSASFSPHVHSPNGHGPRLTPRVSQLRQEESVDFTNVREVAHERETHNAMQMSQSWEDLTLCGGGGGGSNNSSGPASPTRLARLSPGVSPSPTRKAFATRRSLSPIAMRPSCLSPVGRPSGLVSMKRRFDLDEMPAAKRCCWSSDRLTPSTPGTPDSLSDTASGFTFRPVSPRASPLPSPISSGQNHTPQNPS